MPQAQANYDDFEMAEQDVADFLIGLDPIPNVDQTDYASIAERLRLLHAVARIEVFRQSAGNRSKLDRILNPLIKQVAKLRNDLSDANLAALAPPANVLALDLPTYSEEEAIKRLTSDHMIGDLTEIVGRLEEPLDDLAGILKALADVVDHFDRLTLQQKSQWFFEGTTRHRRIRMNLYRYLRKEERSGKLKGRRDEKAVGVDTLVVRHIAELYKFIYAEDFRVTSLLATPSYQKAIGDQQLATAGLLSSKSSRVLSTDDIAQYAGQGIRFGLAVIKLLRLEVLMLPLTAEEWSDESGDMSGTSETKAELAELNRMIALWGRHGVDDRIINKIGHIWGNDKKRPDRNLLING